VRESGRIDDRCGWAGGCRCLGGAARGGECGDARVVDGFEDRRYVKVIEWTEVRRI
jgi:hypothetical protein